MFMTCVTFSSATWSKVKRVSGCPVQVIICALSCLTHVLCPWTEISWLLRGRTLIMTWTLWSFQNEGSSSKSKLRLTDLWMLPWISESKFSVEDDEGNILSLEADLGIEGVIGTGSESEGLWNPNRLLRALAASDMIGISAGEFWFLGFLQIC